MKKTSILVVSDVEFAHATVFEHGLQLAQQLDAELHIVHPVPADHPLSFRAGERFHRLTEMRTRAKEAGVPVYVTLRQGHPAEVATEYGAARAVDLIVVGAEPRTGWKRVNAPSLAEGVVRLTKQPTLVLPVGGRDASLPFDRVVLAVDRIDRTGELMTRAADVLGRPARELTVVHAVGSLESANAFYARSRWLVPEVRAYLLANVRNELTTAVAPYLDDVVDTRVRATAGGALDAIVSQAAESDADLIVVGGSQRVLRTASVTARLVRRADRALLVLPEYDVTASAWRRPLAAEHIA